MSFTTVRLTMFGPSLAPHDMPVLQLPMSSYRNSRAFLHFGEIFVLTLYFLLSNRNRSGKILDIHGISIPYHKVFVSQPGLSHTLAMASVMKSANRLQKALTSSSRATFGAWQMFQGPNLSRFIARAGFDWVCVDCEHGNVAGAAFLKCLPLLLAPCSSETGTDLFGIARNRCPNARISRRNCLLWR